MKRNVFIYRFNVVAVLLLVYNLQLYAQDKNTKADLADEISEQFNLTLQHTTLVVSNFAESKKFYVELLGLKNLKADWLPENQMFLSLGNNLELHVGEVEGVEIKPSSFNHIALSTNDLDGFLNYLKGKGVTYSGLGGGQNYSVYKRPDGVRQTFIQDPDGYWIEINDAN